MSGSRELPEVTHVIGRAEIDRYAELSGEVLEALVVVPRQLAPRA
jgi:hypothetical protein